MIRTLLVFVFSSLFALLVLPVSAQSQDRSEILGKIELLRAELQAKETVFLAPAPEDLAAFAEFLRKPDTGMARLMPREKYDGNLLIRGGGSYYSFTKLTNEYGGGSDVELQRGKLHTGFAGADFGFLTALGNIPIDAVTDEHPGIRYLTEFITPFAEPEAREQQRRAGAGFEVEGFNYKETLPATLDTTYALRSVSYRNSDVLVVLRPTRQDTDGSLILVWRIVRRFPVPQLGPANVVQSSAPAVMFFSTAALAQSGDRETLENEIRARLAELKEVERQFLEPSAKDKRKNAQFLSQPDTGLIRLLPRETFSGKLSISGGGSYYSFTRLTHEYGFGSDIELQQHEFSVGFAGADFGFLTRLGKESIEDATLDNPAAQFLASFTAPTLEPEAREQQQRTGQGFEVNGFTYKYRQPLKAKNTYLLRSISYGYSDLLVAFRLVREDIDGSAVILWKILKRFPVPELARP